MSSFLVNGIFAQLYSLRLAKYVDTQEELVGLRFLLFDYYDFKTLPIWRMWNPLLVQTEKADPKLKKLRRRVLLHLTLFPVIQFSTFLILICIAIIEIVMR